MADLIKELRENADLAHAITGCSLRNHPCTKAADEIEKLRAALVECEHQTHSMRVWGGTCWAYHPPQAGKIAKVARSALDVPDVI